jgi:hypothetical protein
METVIELLIGVALFAAGYYGCTGRWPWAIR